MDTEGSAGSIEPHGFQLLRQSLFQKSRNVTFFAFAAVDPHRAELILRQAHEIEFRPKVRWIIAERDETVFRAQPELFDDLCYLNLGLINEAFGKRFRMRFGSTADLYSAIGYDATRRCCTP